MKIKTYSLISLLSLISIFGLSGCISPGKNVIPRGGMTTAQIYKQETGLNMNGHNEGTGSDGADPLYQARNEIGQRPINKRVNYAGYTETSVNQIHNLFKPLPNPQVSIYIYPHLVNDGGDAQPVPGYTTAFFLYEGNHYALPSEQY